jgi:integrase
MTAQKRHLLEDLHIRRWIAAGRPLARSDGDGLTFTLSTAGAATWVLRYRFGKWRRELTLGNYPDLSLAEARKHARELRVRIDRGGDPAAEKRIDKTELQQTWLVREVAEDFKAKRLKPGALAEGTISDKKSDIDKVILPKLGSLDVRTVKATQIVHLLESTKRSWIVRRRILLTARQVFGHACGKRLIDANPCVGIDLKAVLGNAPPVRKRIMLTAAELTSLLKGADVALGGRENALVLKILLATCVRGNELIKARWENVDLEGGSWWVPDETVKTRQGFLVPLCPTVIGWFRQLFKLACGSAYVLPARNCQRTKKYGDTHVSDSTLLAAVTRCFEQSRLDIRRFTPHDCRSTAKGHLRNLGVSREISEIALNHTLRGMERIYDVREEIPERRAALELWARFLADCEQGKAPETSTKSWLANRQAERVAST